MGNSILITGGTGSFGRAFTERIITHSIYERVIIYSRDEHKQEKMKEYLSYHKNKSVLRFFVGDVRDKDRLRIAMRDVRTVIHAAALKIVPTGEYNPHEFVKTNVLGTQNVIETFAETKLNNQFHSKRMIMLSTDKAVAPINLYGATKLCAEKLTLAANYMYGSEGPLFSVVRYGNVANSNGSVIPVFVNQKKERKDYTITHKDMTRYWIELDEAASYVYSRLLYMQGKEVFIPEMPSFKVMDLIKAIEPDIKKRKIKVIGVRPGEKIHETIDGDKYSNTNEDWLKPKDLRIKLIGMGYRI